MAEETQVGREYVLREEIGRGGVAVVHRATSLRGGPVLAAKQLRVADRRVRDLLLREEAALRDLRHSSIVALHDLVVEGGRVTLLTEYVDGPNLRRHLAAHGGALGVGDAMAIVRQVAEALGVAHAHGVVHLDVKPENVLVVRGTQPPVVKLGDFGVAAVLLDAGLRWAAGATEGYVAPELDAGMPPAAPADVYALGVVLTEVVTGARPGPGQNVPGLPPMLRELAELCLSPDPRDRPTARAVAARLRLLEQDFAAGTAERGAATAPAGPARVPARGTLVAVACTAVLSVAVYLGLSANPGEHTTAAPQPTASARPSAAVRTTTAAEEVPTVEVAADVRVTFAAHLAVGTLYLAIRDGKGIAYLCDGDRLEVWFRGAAVRGTLALTSPAGGALTATFDERAATGTVSAGGRTAKFRLPVVRKPSGLFRAAFRVRGATVRGGWIVLADGTQTGVLTVGGTPRPAPSLDPAARTATDGGTTIDATEVDVESGTGFS